MTVGYFSPGNKCCDCDDCEWPHRLLINVVTNPKPCQTDSGGFPVTGTCTRFLSGITVNVTGPSGYDETGVTGSNYDDLVFEFSEEGEYTITPTGGMPDRFDLPDPVTLTLRCSDAGRSLVAEESEGYVLLCACPTYPIPRTLNWEVVDTPWSGTATYRDDLPDGHPWKYRFVGCASGTHKYYSAFGLPFGLGGYGGPSYLTTCEDSPYVAGTDNCVAVTEDSAGVCWMIFGCSTASLSTPGCPTVGRTCDDGDYFAGGCADTEAGHAYTLAVSAGPATIACDPFEATLPFGFSLMSAALDVVDGGTLRIYE